VKKLFPMIAATGLAVTLSACAGLQLEKAENMSAGGSAFDQTLYSSYVDLSKREFSEGDYRDSDQFATRAIAAAGANSGTPEAINARQLPDNKVDELTNAREWLVDAFGKGAKEKAPEASAQAQANFDCWMQEQEENFQPKDIARCRSDFLLAMAKVDEATREALPTTAAAPAPKEDDAARIDGIYVLFFDFNSSTLKPESMDVVRKAIFDYHLAKPEKIQVSGHTDAAGSNAYNEALSMRRVESVIDAMKAGLVPDGKFTTEAIGEKLPLVRNGLNQREYKNRRVEIIFE